MVEILLFILCGVLIGLSIALLLFGFISERRLRREKLKAMAEMYNEVLLKRWNNEYRYSDDAETVIKAVSSSYILK